MDVPSLQVKSSKHTYPIIVRPGCRTSLYDYLVQYLDGASRYFLITDDQVASLYLEEIESSFPNSEKIKSYILPSGEQSKSMNQYEKAITAALEFKLDRKSVIIAVGGGVVGDLGGFVASTYMRGIRYVQVPTTLLAHDSSVGGKVGINHPLGKNMIGSFHPPSLVLYDPECLLSLPPKEWRSGFAEVIKHGFIADREFLKWLTEEISSFDQVDMALLTEMLIRSIKVKAKIVQEDEQESGIRAFLNFGHTLGHAIEGEMGYGKLTHGEAVAIGMKFALRLSERYFQTKLDYEPYLSVMEKLGYELDIPHNLNVEQLIHRMKLDKKSYNQVINFVLLEQIGKATLVEIKEEILIDELTGKVG
ncbi:3-dehydroquinate synthase [Evansella tamaricis]|uniref:3-dehydroquinate synthase n=1 Tax=Evansella tamaricis TaxID=2069301 RepID=A0ABS6JDS6_9BACI|nr:3-dehydroquinate synthase [Evansella tamaricis]MBU9711822.1 3-dehydroquinate synthase [Evansella tamaricis]